MHFYCANQGKFRTLKHYRPYRFTPSPRRIGSFLAIAVIAGSAACGSGIAQTAPTPSVSAASTDVQRGSEALNRKDYASALNWFQKGADLGNPIAQFNIGWMYRDGLGVKQDYAQALSWFQRAAAQGNAPAQDYIGKMYHDGMGVKQDYAQAMTWFLKAANQGFILSQVRVAAMYMSGEGAKQDFTAAMEWYRKVADAPMVSREPFSVEDIRNYKARAQFTIGEMYEKGLAVPKDDAQAISWYRMAAGMGNAEARAKLAEMGAPVKDAAAGNADAQAAFQFLQRQATIDVGLVQPEPGLSRLQAVDGDICHLRCGFHFAPGIHEVIDVDYEFGMADIAPRTLKWEIDGNNRGFFEFSSADGTALFQKRGRSRKVDVLSFTQKPLSDWTNWSAWQKIDNVVCRSKADKTDLERVLRAFSVLAKSCGARETPF